MSSLISKQLKASANKMMHDLFDTFCREIQVIEEVANATVVDDPNYNAFSDRQTPDVLYSANTTTIKAVVKYLDKADSETELLFKGAHDKGGGTVSAYMRQEYGIIRIKVPICHKDLIRNATKIIVDDQDCQLIYNYTAKSLFDLNYAVFYLARQV